MEQIHNRLYASCLLYTSDKTDVPNLDVNDSDMEGFMNAVKGLKCSKGLDLILHTPGGDPTAAEDVYKRQVSHRMKSIEKANKIIVIDDGRVVGSGSHEELMKSSELYGAMVRKSHLTEDYLY